MKRLALLAALLFASAAQAGPTLTSAPYAMTAAQPDSASLDVGGIPWACTLPKAADGSVTPTCDLTGLQPGVYPVVLTVKNSQGCYSGPDSWDCAMGGGSASSTLLTLTIRLTGTLAKPTLVKVKP